MMLNDIKRSILANQWTSPLFLNGAGWTGTNDDEDETREIFEYLSQNTSTSKLIFQNASMKQETNDAFRSAMHSRSLSSVTLRNLSIDGDENAYQLPETVFQNKGINSLTLSRLSLNSESCGNLGAMIRESQSLHTLSLERVDLESEGLTSFLAALVMTKSLTTLRLQNVALKKRDIQRLLVALFGNRSITNLCLEGLNLDSSDTHQVAMFLRKNDTLTYLSLRGNALDAESAKVLVRNGLVENKTLQGLYLSGNLFGDEGAKYLCELVNKCQNLKELCLSSIKMTPEGSIRVVKALRRNSNLRSISMDGNGLENYSVEVLETVQQNKYITKILDRLPLILLCGKAKADYDNWKEIDLILRANKLHRSSVADSELQSTKVPFLLENAGSSPDVLYFLLRGNATLFPEAKAPRDPPRTFSPSDGRRSGRSCDAFPLFRAAMNATPLPRAA